MDDLEASNFKRLAAAERARQITKLGYDAKHDDDLGLEHLLDVLHKYTLIEPDMVKAAAMTYAIRAFETRRGLKNSMQRDVEKFMNACGQEVRLTPGLIDEKTRDLRIALMTEELTGPGELIESMMNNDLVGIADGIIDALVTDIGTASAYGINIQPVWDEIQRSNMTKAVLDPESGRYKVIKREDGKILKPDSFSPADVESVLMEQTSVDTGVLE